MRQFWRYSLNTARLTRHLARNRATPLRRSAVSAQTVCLVHALGELVLYPGMPQQMTALAECVHVFAPERARADHQMLGYAYAQISGAFARAAVARDAVSGRRPARYPSTRGLYETMADLLHMATRHRLTRERSLSARDLIETFPDTAALAPRLDYEEVLSLAPVPWAGDGMIEAPAA